MPARRTKPSWCIVRGCDKPADKPGMARGYCATHYTRWHRYGVCQSLVQPCERPAVSHVGLCDLHASEGIPT